MKIKSRLMKDRWTDIENENGVVYASVHVNESGYIDRVKKLDHNGGWVAGAVYAPSKQGGLENIMPCTREELRRKGVIC